MRDGGRTPFPSQIPVAWHGARLPELPESDFKHVVKYTGGNRFELSLSSAQVMAPGMALGVGLSSSPSPSPLAP